MATFPVQTASKAYCVHVERNLLSRLGSFLPSSAGKVFVVTTEDVWRLHGETVKQALRDRAHAVLFFPGGEERKRLSSVETLAEQMVAEGGDRSSIVVAFGGGIVGDVGGFLAAIFMRGVPVLQVPTTLLAQVDAAIGGKTGVNLESGKNLIGSFHQPEAVLVDPEVLKTLPEREYRAGLFEVIKAGIIRDPDLHRLMSERAGAVLSQDPGTVDRMIEASVRIKAEVVSADEREGDLRRILNFGHTLGHALEAETEYRRFLHGEAVAFGMRAAVHLSRLTGRLSAETAADILKTINKYGPIPSLEGISPEAVARHIYKDKKTVRGKVHFVLVPAIGQTVIVSGLEEKTVLEAARLGLAGEA